MSMLRLAVATVALATATAVAGPAAATADRPAADAGDPAHARYGGRTIDLARSWEGATACVELGVVTQCYDTVTELAAAHPRVLAERAGTGPVLLAACGSSLGLYDGTSHSGAALFLNTRAVVHNLANFGFDNRTSSYQVGGCSADFFSGSSGSGSVYPGNTNAWASATAMLAGWNNVVSSVYIY